MSVRKLCSNGLPKHDRDEKNPVSLVNLSYASSWKSRLGHSCWVENTNKGKLVLLYKAEAWALSWGRDLCRNRYWSTPFWTVKLTLNLIEFPIANILWKETKWCSTRPSTLLERRDSGGRFVLTTQPWRTNCSQMSTCLVRPPRTDLRLEIVSYIISQILFQLTRTQICTRSVVDLNMETRPCYCLYE